MCWANKTLECTSCDDKNLIKEDFYWQRDGRKVYSDCKKCISKKMKRKWLIKQNADYSYEY